MDRQPLSEEVLNQLINDLTRSTPACRRCFVGTVIRIPVDETGCNWDLARASGWHCDACLQVLSETLEDLRAAFLLLPDPPAERTTSASRDATWMDRITTILLAIRRRSMVVRAAGVPRRSRRSERVAATRVGKINR